MFEGCYNNRFSTLGAFGYGWSPNYSAKLTRQVRVGTAYYHLDSGKSCTHWSHHAAKRSEGSRALERINFKVRQAGAFPGAKNSSWREPAESEVSRWIEKAKALPRMLEY